MSQITSPIALDATLQATNTKLQAIANALGTELTPNKAVVTDSTGKSSTSNTTATEIGYVAGVTSSIQTQINTANTNIANKIADVKLNGTTIVDENKEALLTTVDNVTSAGNQNPLSANQGKLLNDRINNLQNIGRFLAIWNCSTGLPTSEPASTPYEYKTGDYFRIGTVDSTTNYMPNGSSYTGVASTTVYSGTETLSIGAVFYYDGSVWRLQASGGGGTVQDVQIDSTSILSGGIANIPLASTSVDGAMSTEDKTKLNGIEANANNYVLPVASSTLGGIKVWQGTQAQYDALSTKDADTYYFITEA